VALLGALPQFNGKRPSPPRVLLYFLSVSNADGRAAVYRSLARRESETPCMLVFNLAGLPFDPFDVRERKKACDAEGLRLYSPSDGTSSGQSVPRFEIRPQPCFP
jgi:hypothetical protein